MSRGAIRKWDRSTFALLVLHFYWAKAGPPSLLFLVSSAYAANQGRRRRLGKGSGTFSNQKSGWSLVAKPTPSSWRPKCNTTRNLTCAIKPAIAIKGCGGFVTVGDNGRSKGRDGRRSCTGWGRRPGRLCEVGAAPLLTAMLSTSGRIALRDIVGYETIKEPGEINNMRFRGIVALIVIVLPAGSLPALAQQPDSAEASAKR
jgi:hypothetical protein